MIRTGTLRPGITRRTHYQNSGVGAVGTLWKHDLIDSDPATRPAPQAHMGEQAPDSVIGAHFHFQDQFQVVVAGGGLFGKHAVQPVLVHYASRFTGYGPIVAGQAGLSYLTLRPIMDGRANYLPESRPLLQPSPRVNLMSEPVAVSDEETRMRRVEAKCETVLAPRADGIAAWICRVPPNASVPPPVHANGGAQYRVVVGGAMLLEGEVLPRISVAFFSADELGGDIAADAAGLELLVLQYPGDTLRAQA